jgi:hypothetical protein
MFLPRLGHDAEFGYSPSDCAATAATSSKIKSGKAMIRQNGNPQFENSMIGQGDDIPLDQN